MGYSGSEPGVDGGFRPSLAIAITLGILGFLFWYYRSPVLHVMLITFVMCIVTVAVCVLTFLVFLVFGWHHKPTEVRRASRERVVPVVDVAATDIEEAVAAFSDPDADLVAAPGELPDWVSRERGSTSAPEALPSAEPDGER